MKISAIFQTNAVQSYSQTTTLTFTFSNSTIEQVLEKIEQDTEFTFLFVGKPLDVKKTVNIEVRKQNIHTVLNKLLKNMDVEYKIVDRKIILSKKNAEDTKQQTRQVHGIVKDESGEAIIGANVSVKGTTTGTITDIDGAFTLEVSDNAILVVSYIGFITKEVKAEFNKSLIITLTEDTQSLEEVVVVGFGTQKKLNLTGAVSAINNEQLSKVSTPNLANAMAGKLPGLRVLQRTGEPGSYNTDIDIRGFGTALIVVDGVIRTDYNRIDPNDIESISILKDASAAVYGVKAANGVILINTKKGQAGKTTIQFTGKYGFSTPSNEPSTLNVYEQAVLTTESAINMGQTPTYSREQLEQLRLNPGGTDWKALTMNDNAPQQHYNLNITGGTEKTTYFISAGTYLEDGLWKSDDLKYKRYNVRSNLTVEILKGLKASINIGGMMENKYSPRTGTFDILKSIWMHMPNEPAYANDNPNYLSDPGYTWNPIAFSDADISGYKEYKKRNFQGTGILEYDIPFIEGLSAKFMFSYDYWMSREKNFRKKFALYTYDSEKDVYNAKYANNPSSLRQDSWEAESQDLQFFLNYDRTFGDHGIKGLLGIQQTITSGDNFWASRDYDMDALDQLFAATKNPQVGVDTDKKNLYKNVVRGYIGRINYDYKAKYLLELSGRYDASSKFPSNSRWHFFPAFSAGWRMSEENFVKNNIDFLSNLKLRFSYGQMGDEDASNFQFVPGFTYPEGYYLFGGNPVAGLKDKGAINPFITWYTVTTADLGVDVSLWNGLISGSFDLFQRDRDGLLTTRSLSIPGTVGVGLPEENLNSDRTRGFEIELGHRYAFGDFRYNVSGNLSYTRRKWNHYERAALGNSVENYRSNLNNRYTDIWWGYNHIGTITSKEAGYTLPIHDGKGNSNAFPGDIILEDRNNDGVIDSWDEEPLCNTSTPLLNYGFTIDMEWRGFDLNALFQGASKYNIKYVEQLAAPLSWGRNGLDMFMDRWHQEDMFDPDSKWIAGKFPTTGSSWAANNMDTKYRIHSATYLRLKSLEIGYTIPAPVTRKIGIDRARIFVNGFNLLTFSSLNSILDPEQKSGITFKENGEPEGGGGDYGYTYPIMRNYNIGVSITF